MALIDLLRDRLEKAPGKGKGQGEYLSSEEVEKIEDYIKSLEAEIDRLKGENAKLGEEVDEMEGISERVVELEIELRDAKDLNEKFQKEIALLKQDAESLKECKLNLAYWHRRAQNLEKRLQRPAKPHIQGR